MADRGPLVAHDYEGKMVHMAPERHGLREA